MTIAYSNELHDRSRERGYTSARVIAPFVYDLIKPASVVDVGCGHGYWLKTFELLGAGQVLGIDGEYIDRKKLEIPEDRFMSMDLNDPKPVGFRVDLAISIEVAEHLTPQAAAPFVSFLCRLSPCVLFSAAIPGQPGHCHINPQWPAYWAELFKAQGYVALDCIRPRVWHEDSLMLCHRQNMLLYVHESLAGNKVFGSLPRMNCLTLIDHDVLQQLLCTRASLQRMWGRLRNAMTGS